MGDNFMGHPPDNGYEAWKHFLDDLGLFRESKKCSGLLSIVSDYYHRFEKSECRV